MADAGRIDDAVDRLHIVCALGGGSAAMRKCDEELLTAVLFAVKGGPWRLGVGGFVLHRVCTV